MLLCEVELVAVVVVAEMHEVVATSPNPNPQTYPHPHPNPNPNSHPLTQVLRRVHRKASIFGGDIETEGRPAGPGLPANSGSGGPPAQGEAAPQAPQAAAKAASKVDPELILALYRDHIIPLTKVAEVEYLMQRLGPPLVACAGEAGGGSHQAAGRAFCTPGKEPPSLLASGTVPAVFEAVMSNKCAYGVVPLEQGERGVHAATRRLLWSSEGIVVTGEVVREESYRVVSRVPLQQVRRPRSLCSPCPSASPCPSSPCLSLPLLASPCPSLPLSLPLLAPLPRLAPPLLAPPLLAPPEKVPPSHPLMPTDALAGAPRVRPGAGDGPLEELAAEPPVRQHGLRQP